MASSELSPRFVLFVVISLITHLLELAASGLFCHMLMQRSDLRAPWFSVAAGLIIIPMVAVQLASAVFILGRKGEMARCEVVTTAFLHILQLGFIGRHFAILKETPLCSRRTELIEIMILRISFAFASASVLFLMQIYLIFHGSYEQAWTWTLYFSGIINLISVTWATSTFRRCLPESEFCFALISWPGTAFRIVWRTGELLARTIALGLFAALYIRFLILVVGLHWLSMLVCVCVPMMTSLDWSTTSCSKRTFICIVISFAYIFAFINTSSENAVFRYTFYYVIFFLENATLIAVWFIQSSPQKHSVNYVYAYVAAVSYISSITSMIIYYKFFHVATAKCAETRTGESTVICVTCKSESTSNHSSVCHEAADDWLNQNKSGIRCDHSSNKTAQDSLLDSDLNSTVTVSSNVRRQRILDSVGSDMVESGCFCKTKDTKDRLDKYSLSVTTTEENHSQGEANQNCSKKPEKITSESSVSSSGPDVEQTECKLSPKRPVWLPSGESSFANQLLTYSLDSFDTAENEQSSLSGSCRSGYVTISPTTGVSFSKGNSKIASQARSPLSVSQEQNSDPECCSTCWKELQLTPQSKSSWINVLESENECMHCCMCCRQISDASYFKLPLTTQEVPGTENMEERFPHFHHHSHHQHHQRKDLHISHHRSSKTENSSGITKTKKGGKVWTKNLNKHNRHDTRQESTVSTFTRDPKKKGKCSPSRNLQNVSFIDKKTSLSTSADDDVSINIILPHKLPCSASEDMAYSLAQSNRLATELLKMSAQTDSHLLYNLSNSNNPIVESSLDPRFCVRVMTSPTELCASTDEANSSDMASTKTKTSNRTLEQTVSHEKQETRNYKLPDYKAGEIENIRENVDIYSISGTVNSHPDNQAGPSFYVDETEDVPEVGSDRRIIILETAEKQTDVIYENLWPQKQSRQIEITKSDESYTIVSEVDPKKSSRKEVYVYSESEDSALPAEMFTASESDSDLSLEIVI